MKVKKVVDHIKLKNLKDNSVNLSALTGLRRINKVIYRSIVFGFSISAIGFFTTAYYNNIIYSITEGKKLFLNRLDTLPNKETLYMEGHKKMMIEYSNSEV